MSDNRTVAWVVITVARDSMGDVPLGMYLPRLEAAVRSIPGVTSETEVSVQADDVTSYRGLYTDSLPWRHDAMTDQLNALAEKVFAELCAE